MVTCPLPLVLGGDRVGKRMLEAWFSGMMDFTNDDERSRQPVWRQTPRNKRIYL